MSDNKVICYYCSSKFIAYENFYNDFDTIVICPSCKEKNYIGG